MPPVPRLKSGALGFKPLASPADIGGTGGMFVPNNIRPNLQRPAQTLQQQQQQQQQQKLGTGFGGYNNYGGPGGNNYNSYNNKSNNLSLLTNQSINTLLQSYNLGNNLGTIPPADLSGLNDLSGRALSE